MLSPKLLVPQHLLLEFQSFKNDSGPVPKKLCHAKPLTGLEFS
jgi:hypothetical protein